MRSSAVKLTLYNHKGGVGKTTLTVNVGAALAGKGKRVLLIDSDPQSNLTSYFFDDEYVNSLLDNSGQEDGRTVWTAVKPLMEAEGNIRFIEPHELTVDNLFLLPGDIRLSEFEEALGDYWTDCFKRKKSGLHATTSMSILANQLAERHNIDFVFYDTGPNIGPLNRSLLLDCDYFIVPVACDLFSVRALATLGQTLKKWILDWDTISTIAPDGIPLLKGKPKFLGYIPQRFKVYGQAMARDSRYYLGRVQKQIYSDLVSVLKDVDKHLAAPSGIANKLGQVKEFGSLVQMAQKEGVPLSKVHGAAPSQKQHAIKVFDDIADSIINLTCPARKSSKKSIVRRGK